MRAALGVIAAAFVFASGCAQKDWIDRTLVTVDVTGNWHGRFGERAAREMLVELKQQGSTVTGFLQQTTLRSFGDLSGPIEGTVAGDVFRFRNSRGTLEGEVTVSGDEMSGRVSSYHVGGASIYLRRVDPSSSRWPRPVSDMRALTPIRSEEQHRALVAPSR